MKLEDRLSATSPEQGVQDSESKKANREGASLPEITNGRTIDPIEICSSEVQRPCWAISNVAKWVLLSGAVVLGAASIVMVISAVVIPSIILSLTFAVSTMAFAFIPSIVLGPIAAISAAAFGVLLGAKLFQIIREKNILSPSLQRLADIIHATVMEVFCLIGCAVLYPTGFLKSDPKETVQPGQKPVLLVHGYSHNSSGWTYTKARLKHAKVGPVYTINLPKFGITGSIENHAQLVQNKVDAIVNETGCENVTVVGHSMGGIVSMDAATRLDKDRRINQVITLGSPLKGTRIARFGFGQCTKEMHHPKKSEDNPFLADLSNRADRYAGEIHNFYSESDGVVLPYNSAFYEKADKKAFNDLGHLGFLWSDSVIDNIIQVVRSSRTV